MSNSNSVLTAQQGTFIVNTISGVEVSHDAIVVLEDTEFNSINIGEDDVKDEYLQDSSLVIKTGAIIRPLNGKKFSGVRLTSGSVMLVL